MLIMRTTRLLLLTEVAEAIRKQIREELHLTASAGVAPNKFLAKIASDWRKPDGLFVIKPKQVETFLETLPVGRIPGVGKVTEAALASAGILKVGDLRAKDLPQCWRPSSAVMDNVYLSLPAEWTTALSCQIASSSLFRPKTPFPPTYP